MARKKKPGRPKKRVYKKISLSGYKPKKKTTKKKTTTKKTVTKKTVGAVLTKKQIGTKLCSLAKNASKYTKKELASKMRELKKSCK